MHEDWATQNNKLLTPHRFALWPAGPEDRDAMDRCWREAPHVTLPDAVFMELAPSLAWIPAHGPLHRSGWQRIGADGAHQLAAVCSGWSAILAEHPAVLRVAAGLVAQRGQQLAQRWEEHSREPLVHALETLAGWAPLLAAGTHVLYHFGDGGDAGGDFTAPYKLDDDPLTCRSGSRSRDYHAITLCAPGQAEEAALATIQAQHDAEGAPLHTYPVDIDAPCGLLLHQRLVHTWSPLVWSQLARRAAQGELAPARGLAMPYNVIDAASAAQVRRLCAGLRRVCSAAPETLVWPASSPDWEQDSGERRGVWWRYLTGRARLIETLDALEAALRVVERGERWLVWCP